MTALVNIGLATRGGTLRPDHARAVLRAIGGAQLIASRVLQSDTEPTLVAELDPISLTSADIKDGGKYVQGDFIQPT